VRFAGTQHGRSTFRNPGADLLRLPLSLSVTHTSKQRLLLPNFENSGFSFEKTFANMIYTKPLYPDAI